MKKVTASAKSVEEAVEQALRELNATRDEVEINVLVHPEKTFFGLFTKKLAVVEVTKKQNAIEIARDFLQELIDKMGLNVTIDVKEVDNQVTFHLSGEKIGYLIGKRGQTLNSLQFLVNLVANKNSGHYVRIVLDAENYRAKREESLKHLAKRLAEKVAQTKRAVKLEPMTGLERKIIHTALQGHEAVTTYSEGDEPKRRIVIAPK